MSWDNLGRVVGYDGAPGENGAPGKEGPAGPGLPAGGTTGQIPVKYSNEDYAVEWKDSPEGHKYSIVKDEEPEVSGDVYHLTEDGVEVGDPINVPTGTDLSDYLTKTDAEETYATKSEIPSLDNYLTKSIADETYATKSELPDMNNYYTKEETYDKEEVDVAIEAIDQLPQGGLPGQIVKKTETGTEWADETGGGSSVIFETVNAGDIGLYPLYEYSVVDDAYIVPTVLAYAIYNERPVAILLDNYSNVDSYTKFIESRGETIPTFKFKRSNTSSVFINNNNGYSFPYFIFAHAFVDNVDYIGTFTVGLQSNIATKKRWMKFDYVNYDNLPFLGKRFFRIVYLDDFTTEQLNTNNGEGFKSSLKSGFTDIKPYRNVSLGRFGIPMWELDLDSNLVNSNDSLIIHWYNEETTEFDNESDYSTSIVSQAKALRKTFDNWLGNCQYILKDNNSVLVNEKGKDVYFPHYDPDVPADDISFELSKISIDVKDKKMYFVNSDGSKNYSIDLTNI